MDDERDKYREAYRSVWKSLELLDDRLTEPERKAIMNEATRKAKRRESFWLVATFLLLVPSASLLQAFFANLPPWYAGVLPMAFIGFAVSLIKVKISRIKRIGREAMAIIARKRIRPPYCICCETRIENDRSPACSTCHCSLVVADRASVSRPGFSPDADVP